MFSQRVILSNNGTLSDLSSVLSKYVSSSSADISYTAGEDYLYLGSEFPFNHRFIDVAAFNDQDSAIEEVAVWSGGQWLPCVDVFDGTSVGGKTMAQSGIVSWWVSKNRAGWGRDDTQLNDTTEKITGLGTVCIYDLYWVRMKFSDDLKASTALRFVGQKFCDDDDIRSEYPDLLRSDVLDSFTASKTSWKEQSIRASELIGEDMRSSKIIFSKDQILSYEDLKTACLHRTAEIIYSSFGSSYAEARALASGKYKQAMKKKNFRVDENNSGRLEVEEKTSLVGWGTR
jgi:hypothetical protein